MYAGLSRGSLKLTVGVRAGSVCGPAGVGDERVVGDARVEPDMRGLVTAKTGCSAGADPRGLETPRAVVRPATNDENWCGVG